MDQQQKGHQYAAQQSKDQQAVSAGTKSNSPADKSPLPGATLPKGGGAIRGMGEKFEANPVTGTASTTIPVPLSPGRDGYSPSLALSYDSGNGNGLFGFGWSLTLDSITRKTSKGLPLYRDEEESDVFLISGADDLVPLLQNDGTRFEDRTTMPPYVIHRYRPRIEGGFHRIERWSNLEVSSDVHWRVYSPDDDLNIYGRSENSRISNPDAPEQIYTWLLSDCRDWKGNAIVFNYKSENGEGIDMTKDHQHSRGGIDDNRRKANRYIKSIVYGNRTSFLDKNGQRLLFPSEPLLKDAGWLFQAVFDYGEHDQVTPTPLEQGPWDYRDDAFSSYRSGFEVRTTRICKRILMFHHFQEEQDVGLNCLVRSMDFIYRQPLPGMQNRVYTFLDGVEQSGYRRDSHESSGYVRQSMPRLEFKYSEPIIDDRLKQIEPAALENLPTGLASPKVQWIDLYGEGIAGILIKNERGWYYKSNITPTNEKRQADGSLLMDPIFDLLGTVPSVPNLALNQKSNFADLTGSGVFSIVTEQGVAGYFESDGAESWNRFQPFEQCFKGSFQDSGLHLVDLTGDGLADSLFPEDSLWYPSLGTKGFGSPEGFVVPVEEMEDPLQAFKNDILGVTHFADMTGDGLEDVVLIRQGEVSVWPNLGYGKFGSKIIMDNAPEFDDYDMFDPDRVLLADIDASGTTDIIYMHRDGAKLYFNESGNSWSEPSVLESVKDISMSLNVSVLDIFGNGTTSLVISSPLPGDPYPMQYVDLMGPNKPHLLTQIDNNLGSSTRINYSTSTKFYLQDKMKGNPWICKLAFPLNVVESYQNYDYISRNIFTRRFAYHHGYYDGEEREFRGFGMVEQWDTEELSAVAFQDSIPTNTDPAHELPPFHTKSWFHLGISIAGDVISKLYESEYFQPVEGWVLPDTVLPPDITPSEEFDACRSLKGCLLRQEIFADDAPPSSPDSAIVTSQTPYSVTESNFTLTRVQPVGGNRNAVFLVTQRETISQHFERDTSHPRTDHHIVLESSEYGQTLREMAIAYGRQAADLTLPTQWDQDCQTKTYLTYAVNEVTNAIDDVTLYPFSYRLPVNCERKQYELTGLTPPINSPFTFEQFFSNKFQLVETATEIGYEIIPDLSIVQKRLLQFSRTLSRKDDLSSLLPLSHLQKCSIPGQSYSFVFSSAMFDKAYQKNNLPLFDSPDTVLTSLEGDGGGFFSTAQLKASNLFPGSDRYDGYWMANNLSFYSMSDDPSQELADARTDFYRTVRTRNVFGAENSVTYDKYQLLVVGTLNAQGNRATVGERDSTGQMVQNGNDYRLLEPLLITDANGNRATVKCDALGAVVGTAVMGKPGEPVGDDLDGFVQDLDPTIALAHLANPMENAKTILQGATTRVVYDLFAYTRTKNTDTPQPAVAYSIARTTKHDKDVSPNDDIEMRHTFDYSDGFGRVIQSKVQTKPGPVAKRDADGRIVMDPDLGEPILTDVPSDPRWISSGWTIYNNKGLVVANFEPFFTDSHNFEFDVRAGVSPIIFYDALGRPMAALHPNHSYVKNMFSPWTVEEWDNNDTVELDPRTDSDIDQYTTQYFAANPEYQTWLQQRANKPPNDLNFQAAQKTRGQAATPVVSHLDSLGRVFLKVGWNKVVCEGHELDGTEWKQYQRVELDIQGKGIAIRDANIDSGDLRGRIIESYEYDMVGRAMICNSMDRGNRIWLMNALNQPLYQWDDRGHRIKTAYDKSNRHLFSSVLGDTDAVAGPGSEVIFNYNIFGEHHPQATELNLRGTVYLSVDQAGVTVNKSRDFKGNLLDTSKRFNTEYRKTVDWSGLKAVIEKDMDPTAPFNETALNTALKVNLQNEEFVDNVTYDAQNRVLTLTSPNSDGKASKTRITYILGSLVKVQANIRAATSPTGDPVWITFVNDLDYDARNLRAYVEYGNGVKTSYTYSNTGDLMRLLSTRATARGSGTEALQDLNYTYDPSLYQTNITDAAQETVYFRGQVVEPTNDYTYDALYQLLRATGREHLGQPGGSPIPYGSDDSARSGPQPGDPGAMGRYTEDYVYDHAGNMKKMKHGISDPTAPGHMWTRIFSYGERSPLEPTKFSNRLSSATVGTNTESFDYDAHGNMIRMPHLSGAGTTQPNMQWNFLDRTRKLDLGGGGTAYYVYDRTGERVRKVIERSPSLTQERLYLNGTLEIYRVHQSGQIKLERESLHIMDDKNRVALVETRTQDPGSVDHAPAQVLRYQLASHLKSATVELDQNAKVLTYEEYSPYGSTTYSASDSSLELPKRYRFTGKERDEESGLCYHGQRYLCPWLARWTNCDPGGASDGLNTYEYCSSNPIRWADPSGSEGGLPEWLADIVKGRDAEKHAAEVMTKAGEQIEKEVWISGRYRNITKNGETVRRWVGAKRLDIITKELAIQVKWVGVEVNEAGDLITSPQLRSRIVSGLSDASKEVQLIEQHAVGRGWVNERAVGMWGKGGQPSKHVLRFVVDGEAKVVEQFRNFAQTTAAEVAAAGEAAHAVEAIAGTGRTVAELLRPAMKAAAAVGGVALASIGVLGIASAATSLATATNWTDRVVAGVELAASVMTIVPGLNGIGAGLGLAVTTGKLGVAAWNKWGPGAAEGNKAPPVDEPPSPAPPAEAPPSKAPEAIETAPAPQPEPAQSAASPAAPTPKPSAKKTGAGAGGAGAPRMTTLKVMDCKAGHCRIHETRVPVSSIQSYIKSHGGK